MLAKFSNNARPDLYPTDRALAEAYAKILNHEFKECVHAGCEFILFDEPAWTAFPEEAIWAADVMNQASAGLGVKIGLHVCCETHIESVRTPRDTRILRVRFVGLRWTKHASSTAPSATT